MNQEFTKTSLGDEKRVKELKGEACYFSAFFLRKSTFNKKDGNIIPLTKCLNFDNLYPVFLDIGI